MKGEHKIKIRDVSLDRQPKIQSSSVEGDSPKNYGADQQRLQISDIHFDKFPTPATFACWKTRFKTEVCTCSQFPTEAMQWIKEVELVDSVDDLRSSSSIRGIPMPNFEVLDARIASALNKIVQNSERQFSDARQLGCVFQDMKPPKSILRKGTDMPRPIQRVKFTKAIARHAYIRDQNPSLGYICPGEPRQRSPNAPKFEDRSQEETEWQEQGAREAAWKLAKNVLKLKEHERVTFFSPSENWCLPASNLKPGEREFVLVSQVLSTPVRQCI